MPEATDTPGPDLPQSSTVQIITATPASSVDIGIDRFSSKAGNTGWTRLSDPVAVEEPLEIRLAHHSGGQIQEQSISITMRTPGGDIDLAIGFLLTEGLIDSSADIVSADHCGPGVPGSALNNVVKVTLQPACAPDPGRLLRHFYTSSSCGVCGKTSIDALKVQSHYPIEPEQFSISSSALLGLPRGLCDRQTTFQQTGGLHAAGLFTPDGEVILVREDVGRHNALDKLVGRSLMEDRLPWHRYGVVLSGRISFELVQKVAMAGGSFIAAMGPPSSLAIQVAADFSLTLVGFLKMDGFNVYGRHHGIE